MKRPTPDTIAAIATPAGIGGVGMVRVSGAKAPELAKQILGRVPRAREACYVTFRHPAGEAIDQGVAIYFPEPRSFTGEHVLELHAHGGPVVLDMLLQAAFTAGARPARPGEFTERAFLNGKLDLAQAEAVADLIEAASSTAARAALNSLTGLFSDRIQEIVAGLVALRVQIEASLDFPEEELDLLADQSVRERLAELQEQLSRVIARSQQGRLLREGMTVVLAGRPNAGKSSLLNLLAERDAAIVSASPGTTRDVLREALQIDGLPLHVLDTAGLRETQDEIEAEGVRRAKQAMQSADRVLLMIDDAQEIEEGSIGNLLSELPEGVPVTLIRNKIDLSGRSAGFIATGASGIAEVAISAQDGSGLQALHDHLKQCMGYQPAGEGVFSARRRHLDALNRCADRLANVQVELGMRRIELVAEGLRQAQLALAEITGEFSSEDLLGRIFATFCIGK